MMEQLCRVGYCRGILSRSIGPREDMSGEILLETMMVGEVILEMTAKKTLGHDS